MIFRILDAYEEVIKNEDSFFKRISKANKIKKCMAFVVVVLLMGIIPVGCFNQWGYLCAIYALVCVVIIFLINNWDIKDKRKQYLKNAQKYNERLDCLKNLLKRKEFSIDTANKMSVLINKINSYLKQEDENLAKRQQENKDFYKEFIIPVVAFSLGTFVSEMETLEKVAYAIIVVGIILYLKFVIGQIIESVKMLVESTPAKMKCLVAELQDLYDRDYVE